MMNWSLVPNPQGVRDKLGQYEFLDVQILPEKCISLLVISK